MDAKDIVRKNKAKRNLYVSGQSISKKQEELPLKIKYLKHLISRTLLSIIFVLLSMIYFNYSPENKKNYQNIVFADTLKFTKINNLYESFFGKVDITKSNSTSEVFLNTINYSNLEPFKNGFKLSVAPGEAISVITSGIIVFMGEKDNLGNTIIIQGNDGVDIWYSNITDTDISIYDYIEAGAILGTSSSDYIYLTINKDGKYLSYEEYQELI